MKETSNIVMTKGPIGRQLIQFAIPVLFSALLSQMYILVDSLVIGNFAGDTALAAVNNCVNAAWFITSFLFGCAMGASVVISQSFGAENYPLLRRYEGCAVALFSLFGLGAALIGFLLARPLLIWIHTPPEVLDLSASYLQVYMTGQLGMCLYQGISSIFQALGDSRRPMMINGVCVLCNMILDLLFVAVFGWGLAGAAWATAIALFLAAGIATWFLSRLPRNCHISFSDIRIDRQSAAAILKMGIPGGIQDAAVSLANVLVQGSINSFGAQAMAAIGVAASIEGFAFLPMTAFSQALATFTGQNIGARQYRRTREGTRFGLLCMSGICLGIGIAMILCVRQALSWFTRTPAIIELGIQRTYLIALFYPLCGLTHCLAAIFRGAGKPVIATSGYVGCWGILRVALLMIVLPYWHSYTFLNLVYPITWGASTLLLLWFYFFYPWMEPAGHRRMKSSPKLDAEMAEE